MDPSDSHCIMCNRPNNADNLVQCDRCDGYVHYSCADVGDSIADPDRSFTCKRCVESDEVVTVSSHRTSRSSRRTSHSGSSSARVALRLQQLEKEKQNRLRDLEDAEKFQRLRRQVEEDFEKQQFAILDAQLQDEDEDRSFKSRVSSRQIRESTKKWVGASSQTDGANSQVATTSAQIVSTSLDGTLRTPADESEDQITLAAIPEEALQPASAEGDREAEPNKTTSVVSVLEEQQTVRSTEFTVAAQVPTSHQGSGADTSAGTIPSSRRHTGVLTTGELESEERVQQKARAAYTKTNAGLNTMGRIPSLKSAQFCESKPAAKHPFSDQNQMRVPKSSVFVPGHGSEVNRSFVPPVEQQQYSVPDRQEVQPPSGREQCTVTSARDQFVNQPPPGYENFARKPTAATWNPAWPSVPHLGTIGYHSSIPFHSTYGQPDYALNSTEYLTSTGYQQGALPSTSRLEPLPGHQTYPEPTTRPNHQHRTDQREQWQNSSQSQPRRVRGPTAEQLAARQVIPKELPVFAGDPQDWPLFLSSFNNSTEACGYNDAENLARLQQCLRGHALESVRSRLLIPESVPYVLATLERLYGRPEVIIHSLLKRMREIPSPRGDDLKTLIKFGMGVGNMVEHMILAQQHQHISNPMLLQELVDRLPPTLKLQWASFKRHYHTVNLATFNDFMKDLVTMASDVTLLTGIGQQPAEKQEKPKRERASKEKLFVHQSSSNTSGSSGTESSNPTVKPCVHCSKTDHRVAECPDFKRLSVDERWKVLRQKGLCRICLIPHRSWPCRSKQECGVGDCRMRHHALLHLAKVQTGTVPTSTPTERNIVHQNHHSVTSCALMRYLPVTLHYNGNSVEVFAFLDDGSSSTMMEAEVAKQLGAAGPAEPLCLGWTGDITRIEKDSQHVNVAISGHNIANMFPLKARTVGQLKLPNQTVDYEELCLGHPYLRKLPLSSYTSAVPRLIIGVDNAKLISTLKSRESRNGELVAVKTRLGWSLFGKHTVGSSPVEYVHTHQELHGADTDLHNLFRQFMAVDEASVNQSPLSDQDKRALEILQKTTRRIDGRLETGLLWRNDEPSLPNSYSMAVRRAEALERKLAKDEQLREKVKQLIQEYVAKGYAHRITAAELESSEPGRVWYLPLGVVRNPRKPEKVRLIWDAAARSEGVSFNDLMLKGPDLLTALPSVLLRFRQKSVAFSGDIKEMFHQFRIRQEDRQAQRFLFREHPEEPPQIFVMDVATFGAACSPCIAQYLKNRNAEDYKPQYPEAARAIVENHYVDDFLDSVDTVEEAVELIEDVKHVHAMAGMEIRNFASNSPAVLERIGEVSEAEQKLVKLESIVERVLGMVWKPEEDIFTFELDLKEEVRNIVLNNTTPTKRQVLRTIMSLFDPLGLVAHFIVHGKLIMQRIWREGLDWDEAISGEILEDWRRWSGLLLKINEVGVPRCFFSGNRSVCNGAEIHMFVDASENAYACVAYLRSSDNGIPRCTLIAAKTKVAPLKPLSIPRLELQAALIGSRLLDTICKALTIPISARYLWTDSTTVLAWLRSETRRYHQFVGFRVGEILTTTTIGEWRKVQSKLNVADQATKWKDGPSFNPEDWWYSGPSFLSDTTEKWTEHTSEDFVTTEDMRSAFLHHRKLHPPFIAAVERFSKWTRLVRATAYVIRAVKRFLSLKVNGPLVQEELQSAETLLWRQVQREAYSEEYSTLLYNKEHPREEPRKLERSSALFNMSPMLDSNGVLRMNSRITAAPVVSTDLKYPIFLPKEHRVTELLVESYHIRFLHGNKETVFNELRQRFQIPKLRSVVSKVAKQCQYCRVRKATPQEPMMAPLPEIRLTSFIRPFTHIGVDYFGPVFVKQGRSTVKRWIALFTCLSIRAVHLEVVHSLSTQSCVMAIRRFVARRGSPATFCSDNGTNFVGANNLLREQLRAIGECCATTFTNSDTRWLFNPPLAPHMGGSWERLVRSVKAAVSAIADHPRHPSDEVLETIALEAESIVNSRPLTYVPLDHVNQEALSPNHFLLYGTQGINQPSRDMEKEQAPLRDSWKLSKYLVDTFWTRWVREYLPTLTRRTKWFQPVRPLKPGDLVVVVEEGKRNGWVRGRVVEVLSGKDGQVRRAVVQTARGLVNRPATKLALLEVKGVPKDEPEVPESGVPELHGREDVGEPLCSFSNSKE
ncbi:uncharacterized protein LOC134286681 [Aedes albopictus]|uniref:Endonuclease n=1 Tax=Aedes albopictus TaxID=7160 RepID=A0ABM2A4Z1_AEDAL